MVGLSGTVIVQTSRSLWCARHEAERIGIRRRGDHSARCSLRLSGSPSLQLGAVRLGELVYGYLTMRSLRYGAADSRAGLPDTLCVEASPGCSDPRTIG